MYRRGKFWYFDVYINGRRVRTSTKQTSKAKAKLVEAQALKDLTSRHNGLQGDHTFASAAIKYINEVQDRSSLDDIERNIKYLHQHLKGTLLSDIDHDKIEEIIQAKSAEGVSGATVNRLTATLLSLIHI